MPMKNRTIKFSNIRTTLPTFFLLASFLCIGYMATLFLIFSYSVMPGLNTTDDVTFVTAFQGIESRFQFSSPATANLPTIIALFGAVEFGVLAIITNRKSRTCGLIVAGFLVYLSGMVVTIALIIPKNNFIYNAGDAMHINVSKVRAEFNEVEWVGWNNFRAVTSLTALVFLGFALHEKGVISFKEES